MRKKFAALVIAATMPLAGIAAAGAQVDPPEGIDHLIEVAVGDTQQVSAAGGTGGANLTGTDDCSSASNSATCEKTLAQFLDAGTATAQVTPKYPSDFDLSVWLSDETGALVEQVASSANRYSPVSQNESAEFEVEEGAWYVLVVRYFAGGGGYFMSVGVG